ncbi:hypothetical protein ANCCAN_06870 [Ancylostoma caninum]|uniref:Uncharacterized protein n=1 Tax=Ancylostoma caninum TaxID=29170 RepID=A0A368GUQ8_ANCCA|nr:hypothetical protein ANCCAN_06870 [Ancylostoma caninum]
MKFLLFICAFAPLAIQDDYDEAMENVTTRTHLTASSTKNSFDDSTARTSTSASAPKADKSLGLVDPQPYGSREEALSKRTSSCCDKNQGRRMLLIVYGVVVRNIFSGARFPQ